ncbi:hypothetical protein ULMS_14050 [Patiriisocius marinistellae]|uniref:Uncharacterized protein n=1 Tax=Patiriisocius marinistellae TaxID=2494560 RepID=A0A5J4FTP3_9FLAO|nr:hypothetical protein [Patiriisocius marinistellae]GEQ85897.1 hypothetical protein ULMS_14050 [Patiriisocius marinistellae]
MDQLELLKSKWQQQEQTHPTLSYKDIYKMLLKKSSSIVKWIFMISIAEILFWIVISFLTPESNKDLIQNIGLKESLSIISIFHYVILAVFLVLFYLNYKKIKVTDTAKELMANILKTRKTVKYFVIYNVLGTILAFLYVNMYFYTKKTELYTLLTNGNKNYAAIPAESFTSIFFITQLVVGAVFIGLLVLVYRIIYGILLKRLKNNYDELERIEL